MARNEFMSTLLHTFSVVNITAAVDEAANRLTIVSDGNRCNYLLVFPVNW